MANFKNMSFTDIDILRNRGLHLMDIFGEGTFTRRNFETLPEKYFGWIKNEYHPYTLEAYLNENLIIVARTETFKIYGVENRWGEFESCPDMTDDIYNILPAQLQKHIVIQERKRNYYQVNLEFLNEITKIYNALKELKWFKD